jgi:chromate transporter
MNPALHRPRSCWDLFVTFTWMAMQGFGGVQAVVQRILVDQKQWLTPKGFLEDWSVAQTLPGPHVVNLTLMLGDRYFGLKGAMCAIAGLMLAPCTLVLCFAALYQGMHDMPAVRSMLHAMGCVVSGMIMGNALRLLAGLKGNPMGLQVCYALLVAGFVVVAVWRIPLALAWLSVGLPSSVWAWRCMVRKQGAA